MSSSAPVTGYFARSYGRTWLGSVISAFVGPTLYLAALGVGLGSFVGHGRPIGALGGVSYLGFVAPALVATTAMQTAATEATYPVMGALKWNRSYLAMLATPLEIRDVLVGHLAWMAARVTGAVTVYVAVAGAFGAFRSPLAILDVPAGVLTGMAFAAPLAAFSARQDNDTAFALVFRLGVVPLFLFSGTFFPVKFLPETLRLIAEATPLYRGVDLCRSLSSGVVSPGATAADVAYLAALGAVGFALALRSYERRLKA